MNGKEKSTGLNLIHTAVGSSLVITYLLFQNTATLKMLPMHSCSLAIEAGNRRIPSLSPSYDTLLTELAAGISAERKELFELFAPRSDQRIDTEKASRMATRLTESATEVTPLLNPAPYLSEVLSEVHLFHGRTDSLIPYTETLLANTLLPRDKIASSTITGLFEHSERGNRLTSVFQEVAEATNLIRALSRVLSIV